MAIRIRNKHKYAVVFMLLLISIVNGEDGDANEPAPENASASSKHAVKPIRNVVTLPGMIINRQHRHVDLEGSICLDEGMLELIACTKGTKEHESIVAVTARPAHIHAALLLIGANKGNPAMRKLVDGPQQRWVDIPPQGDPISVFLVFKNTDGKSIEHPISKFIKRHGLNHAHQIDGKIEKKSQNQNKKKSDAANENFAETFLFAGSHIHTDGSGPPKYLADESGNVISISTFGDEILCLPGVYGHANGSLIWQINAAAIPKVGTKVILRLRSQVKPTAKHDKPSIKKPK